MPSQYETKVPAEVLADARLGKTGRQIATERNLPERTTQHWLKAAREKAQAENRDPLLYDGEYRLAFMTQELTEQAVESLKDSGQPLYKYLVPLNVVRGTAIDKIARASQLPQVSIQADKLLIVLNSPKPELLEPGKEPDVADLALALGDKDL